jgi:hypothetical protein
VNPKTAAGVGGAFLAGGAAASLLGGAVNPEDAPSEFEADVDGQRYMFQMVRELDPTEEFPNGAALYNITEDRRTIGYWVLLGVRGRNLILLDEDRTTRTAQISVEDFQQMIPSDSRQQFGGSQ